MFKLQGNSKTSEEIIFKPDDFIGSKPLIMRIYEKDGFAAVQIACAMVTIPCLAAYTWIWNKYKDPEAMEGIERLKKFYQVAKIEGLDEKGE